ncbi:MAG: RrF2 family transcriptional regulator [Spirochaetia bacterium]|nr:RrF2 family transcriptional regulator [Spirochaetia bacterium]MBR0318939.1 RrF2 family transcriptional regulator [Spirochaetia bacterium]
MMISTRGRYALRVMIDLAEHQNGSYIPMKDVADRQDISLKYLERIVPVLTQEGFIEGLHGKGGGYRLVKAPEDCRVGDILRLTEGDLAPVACLAKGAQPCGRAAECRTLAMWQKFNTLINDYFDGITIADLMKSSPAADNYII